MSWIYNKRDFEKKFKVKKCFICGDIIEYNCITYMPQNVNLCSNDCLIEYRKTL